MFSIDLKSDTVTKPSIEMRKAMFEAEVGDDVYCEDPTVVRLEKMAAKLLEKEAALYVTSGTQGNLVALLTHCGRGEGAIVGKDSHIQNYEGGGLSALGGIVSMQVEDIVGLPSCAELSYVLKPTDNVHFAHGKLLCLENTHNRGGGHASTPEEMAERASWAHEKGLSVHLDGARLFNAAVALGVSPANLTKDMDSVQICLSKGLGAPMGSLICGSSDFIERARFWRKKLGGGLRQVGIVAASGIYALEHNVERLAIDHENAALIKDILEKGGLETIAVRRPTNMVYFKASDEAAADMIWGQCQKQGVFFNKTSPDTFRLVTHLDVSRDQALLAAETIVKASKGGK